MYLYQLHGGIHRYLEAYPNGGLFKGKNFVFDGRVAIGPAEADEDEVSLVIGQCIECQCSYDKYCGDRVCTVCRAALLVCDICLTKARFPDELHCMNHRYMIQHIIYSFN